jgi:hypothetical protein
VRYETVEKTKDNSLQARLVVREGPTGLILTTTRAGLHPENETRMLSLDIDDSPLQTKAILAAHAGITPEGPDLTPLISPMCKVKIA